MPPISHFFTLFIGSHNILPWTGIVGQGSSTDAVPYTGDFKPVAGATWNIQLLNPPERSAANDDSYGMWDMDLFDTDQSTIDAFHANNRKVVCYFSAGSYEDGRPDSGKFPAKAKGKKMVGWDEKWLDTRNADVRDIMKKRMDLAKAKHCDGVDPDNIDGYSNDTGFDLTEDDGVDYVKFLADYAHGLGMAYGLKNGNDIVDRVVEYAQWSVQEQCAQQHLGECQAYRPFLAANKPVFHLEYTENQPASARDIADACNDPAEKGFSTLIKHMDLAGWTQLCP